MQRDEMTGLFYKPIKININHKNNSMKIKLGIKVRDKVTGFEGIATAKIKYLNGCVQFCVKPQATGNGKMPEGEYIDVAQLEPVGVGVSIVASPTGGPQADCPNH